MDNHRCGQKVVVTRPERDFLRTAKRLTALGYCPVSAPVSILEATGMSCPAGDFSALLLTSANALTFMTRQDLALLRKIPCFTVGDRTADAARASGFTDVISAKGDARTLIARFLVAHPQKTKVLYLAGETRKNVIEDSLRAEGYDLSLWFTYRVRGQDALPDSVAMMLRAAESGIVLHYSRVHAALFADLVIAAGLKERAYSLRHLCISADVASGLAKLAPVQTEIATRPDEDTLLSLLGQAH